MMLDAAKGNVQKEILTRELETMGIRLNKDRPDIYFKVGKHFKCPSNHFR